MRRPAAIALLTLLCASAMLTLRATLASTEALAERRDAQRAAATYASTSSTLAAPFRDDDAAASAATAARSIRDISPSAAAKATADADAMRVRIRQQNSAILALGASRAPADGTDARAMYERMREMQEQLGVILAGSAADHAAQAARPRLAPAVGVPAAVASPPLATLEPLLPPQVALPRAEARALLSAPRIAVLIVAYNRPRYLDRALSSLYQMHPGGANFPVFVSQDGENAEVSAIVAKHGATRMVHPRVTLELPKDLPYLKKAPGYAYLSVHYGWAIRQLFGDGTRFEGVILLEEDIEVGIDFFGYFNATAPLLYEDPSLLCVSGYSDNGQERYAHNATRLFRSDFFPGLGWLLSRQLWAELDRKWPENRGFWDDWLREPPQRRGRASIRPELSRTRTFGEVGTSKSQFYKKYLSTIRLSTTYVRWDEVDVSYLLKDAYDNAFAAEVAAAREVSVVEALAAGAGEDGELRLSYSSARELKQLCNRLQIMEDLKAGVPRTGYGGVVSLPVNGRLLHLTPTWDVIEQDITRRTR